MLLERSVTSNIKDILNAYTGRCKFYDHARINPQQRKVNSPIIQFYSSINNIGNFLPVLGISKMLGQTADTWCMHDKEVDFDFINANYKCAIIGGAGLFHRCFDHFWQKLLHECKIPIIIWGVGTCFPDDEEVRGVDPKIMAEVVKRCDLINVRDELTANYYNLKNVSITACPTIVYLQDFKKYVNKKSKAVLFSSHVELVSDDESEEIQAVTSKVAEEFKYTNNLQRRFTPLKGIITNSYCQSRVVVTTRLHGSIIPYGLGIPYIMIPRDEKLRAFHSTYGNGININSASDIEAALKVAHMSITKPIEIQPVLDFGVEARNWVRSHCN